MEQAMTSVIVARAARGPSGRISNTESRRPLGGLSPKSRSIFSHRRTSAAVASTRLGSFLYRPVPMPGASADCVRECVQGSSVPRLDKAGKLRLARDSMRSGKLAV